MAYDQNQEKITYSQAVLPEFGVVPVVHAMQHGDSGYILKEKVGPVLFGSPIERRSLWVDGRAHVYPEVDLKLPYAEGGLLDEEFDYYGLVRIISLIVPAKKEIFRHRLVIDASHLALDPRTPTRRKFEPIDWDGYEVADQLVVNDFAGNELDWSIIDETLRNKYNVNVGKSVLHNMTNAEDLGEGPLLA
jgi:hypothetical protein